MTQDVTGKAVSKEHTAHTEVVFGELIGLFEQTQAAMQKQAARSVDIALVVRTGFLAGISWNLKTVVFKH